MLNNTIKGNIGD